MQQHFSTRRAAKLIGVHLVTLKRWLARGKIRPSIALPFDGRTLWRFTRDDVRKFRKFKETQKRGPKPKKRRK
jgi:excisionase family DNA binding protein